MTDTLPLLVLMTLGVLIIVVLLVILKLVHDQGKKVKDIEIQLKASGYTRQAEVQEGEENNG